MDTFSPIGPAITTKDEIGEDINHTNVKCYVNGAIVQSSNTDQLVFNAPKLIAWISQFITLKPVQF